MTNARRGHVFKDSKTGKYGYVVDVAGPGQPRKQQKRRGFVRERDALDALNRVARAVADGAHAPPSKVTVAELLEEDFRTQANLGLLRPSTIDGYRRLLDAHVRPAIGGIRAQELRASHLDTLYGSLLAGGRRQATGKRGKGLSPATVRLVHSMLSGAFSRASKRGDVAANPCQRATPPASQTPETATWSIDQLREFLAHEAVRSDPDAPLWRTMAATGLRRGEALALGWDDVDLDAGVIHVRRNAVMVGSEVMLGPPKTTRSKRRVKIGPDSIQLLHDHLARQREQRVALGAGWHDHGLVFPGLDGRPRNPVNVSSVFRALVAKTGLPAVTLHALRHGHATLLLDQGERVHDVAARLGHDPAVLLRTYAHHGGDSQDSAAALEALLDGSQPPLRVVPDGEDAQNPEGPAVEELG
jgi:integrase